MMYTPANHYWIVAGDATQVFSSARAQYVPVADALFTAWLATGIRPTNIDTEANLSAVLYAQYPAGLSAAMASALRAQHDATQPDLASLRDQAQAALDNNTAYLAIISPTNAQIAAQVKALTQQNQRVIQALKRLAVVALG